MKRFVQTTSADTPVQTPFLREQAARRWELLEKASEAALIPPKHPNYPGVEDAIWQGLREALLSNKSVEEALQDTETEAVRAAEGSQESKDGV